MVDKYKLNNGKERVSINNHLTKKDVKQYKLRTFIHVERGKGNQVKMGFNKAIDNGDEQSWNDKSGKIIKNILKIQIIT